MRIQTLCATLCVIATGTLGAQTPGTFSVSGVGCPTLGLDASTAIAAADDAVSVGFALGFSFAHPGGNGSTSVIDIAPNGYVYLESGTNSASRCCAGATGSGGPIPDFLTATPSFAVFGQDLDPSAATGRGSVHFETNGVDQATITWDRVAEKGVAGSSNTVSLTLFATGIARMCWHRGALTARPGIVGFSPGGNAIDIGGSDFSTGLPLFPFADEVVYETFTPGSFDLNETCVEFFPAGRGSFVVVSGPSATPFVDPLEMSSTDVPTTGQLFTANVAGISPTSLAGSVFIGNQALGGIPLDAIGMQGCRLYTSPSVGNVPIQPGGAVRLFIPNDPGVVGLVFQLQATTITPMVNALGVASSNLGTMFVGN